jgi:hypothetical protein
MNKATKMLKVLKSVTCRQYKVAMLVRENMSDFEVIEKQWSDSFQQKYESLDLSKIETWSTYNDCVSLRFIFVNPLVAKCEITIWNGEMCYGEKTSRRFTATLMIPTKFLTEIKGAIACDFNRHCSSEYSDFLERQKEEWIDKFKKDVLK